MESLFDGLIPLLIILFYLFGNVFRKKGEKEAPPPAAPSYPQPEDESPSLREEIRRRFEERARQLRGEAEPELPVQQPTEPEPLEQVAPPSPSSVDATLRDQEARLEEVHRKATAIRQEKPQFPTHMSEKKGTDASVSIRSRLRSPKAVSEAIVLMEVLGPPVGLRKPDAEMRPNFGN